MATLETLIPLLQQAHKSLSEEQLGSIDIADMIWLATQLKLRHPPYPPREVAEHDSVDLQSEPDPNNSLPQAEDIEAEGHTDSEQGKEENSPDPTPEPEQPSEASVAPTGSPAAQKAQNLQFNVPAARAIPQRRQIARSLRCLNRKVPSRITKQIDIPATICRISEEQLCIPVYKPAPRRWLDIALVIEKSDSFGIWEQTIKEWTQLLLRQGAFRDVKRWYAHTDSDKGLVLKSLDGSLRHPKELIAPQGDRLILVVSDCISDAWYGGGETSLANSTTNKGETFNTWFNWLTLWQVSHPVTIIHMLPPKFWQRTAIGSMDALWMSSRRVGALNHQWQVERDNAWDEMDMEGIPIPVLTLDPYALKVWAKGLVGASQVQVAGVSFEGNVIKPKPSDVQVDVYDTFMQFGSPVAKRLAALLSAVPIQLPIVRLVQKNLLKNESSAVQVAEIFFSGILKPRNPEPDPDPEKRLYDFGEGIRNRLNQTLPKSELATVIDYISRDIMRRAGFDSLDQFRAYLVAPPSEKDDPITTEISEFARVSFDVLRGLGGEYAEFVETIEQIYRKPQWPELETFEFQPPKILIEDETEWPTIETREIEVVLIALESDLYPLQFEVVQLTRPIASRLPFVNVSWSRKVVQSQAEGFTEELGENVALDMVLIPSGSFVMGSSREQGSDSYEKPQHKVDITPFGMGRYPITQAQWKIVASMPQIENSLKSNPSFFKGNKRPVVNISWQDAVEFCQRLSQHTGRIYRLPSEAEWEYACRAGTTTPFHFGEMITSDLVNYRGTETYGDGPKGEYRKETTDVDTFPSNAFGLHDMHGNVWEWCADHWHENYKGAPTNGQAWIKSGDSSNRVVRGGCWDFDPVGCRSAYRYYFRPAYRHLNIGFRVVCEFRETP